MTGQAGSQLDLLVENLGRINYGKEINDFKVFIWNDFKSHVCALKWSHFLKYEKPSSECESIKIPVYRLIVFPVSQGIVSTLNLGSAPLTNWTMYSLSIDEAVSKGLLGATGATQGGPLQTVALSPPTFYGGSFIIPDGIPDLPQDTYIQLPKWRKARDDFTINKRSIRRI